MIRLLRLLGGRLMVSLTHSAVLPSTTLTVSWPFHVWYSATYAGLLENGSDHTGLIGDLGAGTILISCLVSNALIKILLLESAANVLRTAPVIQACTPIGWTMAPDFAQRMLAYLQPDKGICLFMKQANQIVKDRLALKERDRKQTPSPTIAIIGDCSH